MSARTKARKRALDILFQADVRGDTPATVLAAAGVPVWACLLVVLASPVAVIVSFELSTWRSLEDQLARVVDGAGRTSSGT